MMLGRRLAVVGTLALAGTALSGCVAAVAAIPLAAAGAISYKGLTGSEERTAERMGSAKPARAPERPAPAPAATVVSVDPVADPQPAPTPAPPPPPPAPPAVPAGMQFLYGSGEAAALSLQAYQGLWTYLTARAADRRAGREVAAVVLAQGATLAAPRFTDCGKKPLAAVFDVDETVLLNLGYEAWEAANQKPYDDARWQRWEATGAGDVAAVPGAVEAIEAARRDGITIVFNTNRSAGNAANTIAALEGAGLGRPEVGRTLWLRGDGPGSSGKDGRRWDIAAKYCVIALVGDQLGDFSDLFNVPAQPPRVRRALVGETMVAPLWGAGWFVLPNPVYGTGLRGGIDEVFPADKRWDDPAGEK